MNIWGYSPERLAAMAVAAIVVLAVVALFAWKYRRRIKSHQFTERWSGLQKKLPNKQTWREAIIDADDLLDDALKKHKIKGRTMGERLVNAQKIFSDNDSVWYGHKLRKKIEEDPDYHPKKAEVRKALLALRVGLKDIGAL